MVVDTTEQKISPWCRVLHHAALNLLEEVYQRTEADDALSAESVHRQRILIKQLRSYQQLIRPLLPVRSINYANLRIKKVGMILSGRRDRDVLMKTHQKLLKKTKNKKTIKSLKALEDLLNEIREESPATIPWSKIRQPVKIEIGFWNRQLTKWASDSDEKLIQGLSATYSRARKRFKSAYEDKDRNRYHDWRKWSKFLLYQLHFFSQHGGPKSRKQLTALTKLGKLLGIHQDLQIYRKYIHQVSAHDFSSDQLARCDVLIRQREKALESQCKKIGDQCFKEKATQFERRMRDKCLSSSAGEIHVADSSITP